MDRQYLLIPLNDDNFAIVDREDLRKINPERSYPYFKGGDMKWHLKVAGNSRYAVASLRIEKNRWMRVRMHRLILGLKKGDKRGVDHINGNGLDNRKKNLRICNQSQNLANSSPRKGSSKYKGVVFSQAARKWTAQICVKKKSIYIGSFENEEDAAKAYDSKAKEMFGDYYRPNFPILV